MKHPEHVEHHKSVAHDSTLEGDKLITGKDGKPDTYAQIEAIL